MYKLNPYYITSEVMETPDCMYKLKRIYDSDQSKSNSSAEGVDSDIAALEKRQEEILAKLEHLKNEVDVLSQKQSKDVSLLSSSNPATRDKKPAISGVIQDIVINANPANPPLSVLVLCQILSQQYNVLATSYVHSSVPDISPSLKNVFLDNVQVMSRSSCQYALSLIWKNDKFGTSMMLSPNVQTHVYGEANIARYLARLLNPAYDTGDIVTAAETDQWLDCATQIIHGNNKERASVLRLINARLGKHTWLVGSSLTLADIVMWSALQQCKMTQAVPGNVKQWLDNCSQQSVFQHACQVVIDL